MNSPSERPAEKGHDLDSAEDGEAYVMLVILNARFTDSCIAFEAFLQKEHRQRGCLLLYSLNTVATLSVLPLFPVYVRFLNVQFPGFHVAW